MPKSRKRRLIKGGTGDQSACRQWATTALVMAEADAMVLMPRYLIGAAHYAGEYPQYRAGYRAPPRAASRGFRLGRRMKTAKRSICPGDIAVLKDGRHGRIKIVIGGTRGRVRALAVAIDAEKFRVIHSSYAM
jgi:hypothetical protein